MKSALYALCLVGSTLAGQSALAAQVGVSIGINQPGLYGRIDLGAAPVPPALVYTQPQIIVPGPVAVNQRPIYLHVPPAHSADWRHYCGRYNACGQPVYFVRNDWYAQHYYNGRWREERREERREDRREERREDRHDHR